jgi:hypothetical protein
MARKQVPFGREPVLNVIALWNLNLVVGEFWAIAQLLGGEP